MYRDRIKEYLIKILKGYKYKSIQTIIKDFRKFGIIAKIMKCMAYSFTQ